MIKIAILDDYAGRALSHTDWSALKGRAEITVFDRAVPQDEAAETLAPFDVLCTLRERMALPASLLERLPNLKLITIVGGVPGVDSAAAERLGVKVVQAVAPASSQTARDNSRPAPQGTTELTWALILAAQRHLDLEMRAMRAGRWQTTVGIDLSGQTLGLLGLGRLAQAMLPIARAFRMTPIAWSTNLDPAFAESQGVEYVSKQALFERSDVLCIQLVLGDRSRGLVQADDLARMKPGALLVNTSRGPIVDEAALIAAVSEGRIRAALDVYDQEPLPAGHPLRKLPGATLTPHIGFVTPSMLDRVYGATRDVVLAWLDATAAA
jgi:phosphoglycerate dehydrogenase-like enzyme